MKWIGASRFEFHGKSIETEKTTWSEFTNGGKVSAEQTLTLAERNESKRVGLWESQSEIWLGKLTI